MLLAPLRPLTGEFINVSIFLEDKKLLNVYLKLILPLFLECKIT